MPKPFIRVIVLVMVPCLLMDPARACALPSPHYKFLNAEQSIDASALATTALPFKSFSLRISPRLPAWLCRATVALMGLQGTLAATPVDQPSVAPATPHGISWRIWLAVASLAIAPLVAYWRDKESSEGTARSIDDLLSRANGLLRNNDETSRQQALEMALLALELNNRDPRVHGLLARIYAKLGQIPKAIDHGEIEVSLDRTNPNPHYLLGLWYYKIGRYEKGLEHFEKYNRLVSDKTKIMNWHFSYVDAAEKLLEEGHPKRCRMLCMQALRKDRWPEDPRLHGLLSDACRTLHEFKSALFSSEEAVRLAPNDPRSHMTHGLALLSLDRDEEAAAAFHQVLNRDSKFPGARRMLDVARSKAGPQRTKAANGPAKPPAGMRAGSLPYKHFLAAKFERHIAQTEEEWTTADNKMRRAISRETAEQEAYIFELLVQAIGDQLRNPVDKWESAVWEVLVDVTGEVFAKLHGVPFDGNGSRADVIVTGDPEPFDYQTHGGSLSDLSRLVADVTLDGARAALKEALKHVTVINARRIPEDIISGCVDAARESGINAHEAENLRRYDDAESREPLGLASSKDLADIQLTEDKLLKSINQNSDLAVIVSSLDALRTRTESYLADRNYSVSGAQVLWRTFQLAKTNMSLWLSEMTQGNGHIGWNVLDRLVRIDPIAIRSCLPAPQESESWKVATLRAHSVRALLRRFSAAEKRFLERIASGASPEELARMALTVEHMLQEARESGFEEMSVGHWQDIFHGRFYRHGIKWRRLGPLTSNEIRIQFTHWLPYLKERLASPEDPEFIIFPLFQNLDQRLREARKANFSRDQLNLWGQNARRMLVSSVNYWLKQAEKEKWLVSQLASGARALGAHVSDSDVFAFRRGRTSHIGVFGQTLLRAAAIKYAHRASPKALNHAGNVALRALLIAAIKQGYLHQREIARQVGMPVQLIHIFLHGKKDIRSDKLRDIFEKVYSLIPFKPLLTNRQLALFKVNVDKMEEERAHEEEDRSNLSEFLQGYLKGNVSFLVSHLKEIQGAANRVQAARFHQRELQIIHTQVHLVQARGHSRSDIVRGHSQLESRVLLWTLRWLDRRNELNKTGPPKKWRYPTRERLTAIVAGLNRLEESATPVAIMNLVQAALRTLLQELVGVACTYPASLARGAEDLDTTNVGDFLKGRNLSDPHAKSLYRVYQKIALPSFSPPLPDPKEKRGRTEKQERFAAKNRLILRSFLADYFSKPGKVDQGRFKRVQTAVKRLSTMNYLPTQFERLRALAQFLTNNSVVDKITLARQSKNPYEKIRRFIAQRGRVFFPGTKIDRFHKTCLKFAA
jgi:tetratricopeptide (TPR) repeat protein